MRRVAQSAILLAFLAWGGLLVAFDVDAARTHGALALVGISLFSLALLALGGVVLSLLADDVDERPYYRTL